MTATTLRMGRVSYRTGWVRSSTRLADEPRYATATVEEYTLDGTDRYYCYYPAGVGCVELPADLLGQVRWSGPAGQDTQGA